MGTIEAIAVILAAIATIAYATLTYRMVGEMQRTREAQERPYVFVDLDRQEKSILLVISNYGNGPAANVSICFDQKPVVTFENAQESQRIDISDLPLVLRGIPFMPPRREITTSIGLFSEYFEKVKAEGRPLSYTGRLRYTNSLTGEQYAESFVLDFAHFEGIAWPVRRDMDDLVKELEQIRKMLQKRP